MALSATHSTGSHRGGGLAATLLRMFEEVIYDTMCQCVAMAAQHDRYPSWCVSIEVSDLSTCDDHDSGMMHASAGFLL